MHVHISFLGNSTVVMVKTVSRLRGLESFQRDNRHLVMGQLECNSHYLIVDEGGYIEQRSRV